MKDNLVRAGAGLGAGTILTAIALFVRFGSAMNSISAVEDKTLLILLIGGGVAVALLLCLIMDIMVKRHVRNLLGITPKRKPKPDVEPEYTKTVDGKHLKVVDD